MAALSRESPTPSGDGGNDTIICGDSDDDRANGDNFALSGTASGDGGDDLLLGCDRSTGDNFALNGLASARSTAALGRHPQ
jgi:hypothetical protein